jgi:hypothetical protein
VYIKDTLYNIRFYSFFIILSIILSSCSKEDYEVEAPTYISIDHITLSVNQATEGSSSSNIVDAWVFIDDDLVGVYELPATFPVLKEGSGTLKVYAGIKDNGIAAARKRYLLYDPHVEQVNLIKGETIVVDPVVTYASGTKFTWIEDFENASISFLYNSASDTIINKQSNDVKEGVFSGQVYLDAGMDFFEATSFGFTTVPRTGVPVYLELDCKTNEELIIGVYLDLNQYAWIGINPTTEWKKIYIDLGTIINNEGPASEMKVFLGIKSTSSNPFITSNPEIHIDNLKLIHF